tara:strand:- start:583 stop:804 length:222 start_codon:yes stop_codon:yes gene_type:complete
VRDGIAAARSGLPAVAFVTEDFWPQGDFVAKSEGMPDLPRVKLPHPVAGSGLAAMQAIAEQIAEEVLARLTAP